MTIIEHYYYEIAQKNLKSELDNFREGHMVFLIGPSGAGKTTLRHAVMQELFGDPTKWGRGRTPAIETIATMPTGAFYNSLALAKTLHCECHAPYMHWLFPNPRIDSTSEKRIRKELKQCRETWEKIRPRRATEEDYWNYLVLGLIARECKYVSIDQVTALLVNRSNKEPAHHIAHLMAIAERAKVMFIMTGTHAAARLWEIHPELRRRVQPVWMPPYSAKRKDDKLHYLRLLKTLSSAYVLSKPDLLCTMAHEILAATGGVFAEITQLLDRAARKARIVGARCIQREHIEASYYNDIDLQSLWRDVNAFEQVMTKGNIQRQMELVNIGWGT